MNELAKRQLNLLVHLAGIDGKFEKSEHELLNQFIKEKGLRANSLDQKTYPVRFSDFSKSEGKAELLYWALKLMHADAVVHPKEILFCEHLAIKLGYTKEIVFAYSKGLLSEYSVFKKKATDFLDTAR